uniref:Uncharacterized protein n=1 Tax=Picea sitchensis TaxID=3332 RepID=A0A6B9XUC6_PICSI|nr:hypothetical protein Q903MT_gene5744 [Picea sitchensis]
MSKFVREREGGKKVKYRERWNRTPPPLCHRAVGHMGLCGCGKHGLRGDHSSKASID